MRRPWISVVGALALVTTLLGVVLGATALPASAAVTATDLGTLGCTYSGAAAVLDSGQVVGQSCLADGTSRVFSWTAAGGMIDLGALGGSGWTELGSGGNAGIGAVAVSDTGQVVGTSNNQAFSWTQADGMIALGELPGDDQSNANAVNNSGQVVGYSAGPLPGGSCCEQHAFSWTEAGGMVDLGTLGGTISDAYAVNNNGQVVGYSTLPGDTVTDAFSWTEAGGMIDLGNLGGDNTTAEAVNDNGEVVGASTDSSGDNQAFAWTPSGGMIDLGTLGGSFSVALGVNNNGQVVGYSSLPGDTVVQPFLWSSGVMTDLGSPSSSFTETFGYAINDNGEVVGEANSAGNNCPCDAFVWTPSSGMVDLGSLSSGAASASVTTGTARGISDRRVKVAFKGKSSTVNSGAVAVNDLGQAAGHSTTSSGQTHAVLWSPSPTTVRVVSSRDPSPIHHPVTFRATVSAVAGRPKGTVSFYDGPIILGTSAVHRGKATFTTSELALGGNDITAEYTGNTNFEGSTSADLIQAVTNKTN
jgi:probable HAF family extracellular repeat protein